MPNINNEGFAITPQEECVGAKKPVFWSDDNNTDMHALRTGTLNCTVLIKQQTITFDQPAAITFGSDPVPLVASSTSGLPVAFTASGPCSVTGSAASPTLTLSGAGTCTVTASQAGDAGVAPAPDVLRTVTINKAATSLSQRPVSLVGSLRNHRVTYSAVLTSQATGRPVAGQTIAFSASSSSPGTAACTAVTDSAGTATCTSPLPKIVGVFVTAGSTTARYTGSADYEPSSTTTPFQLL